MKLDLGHHGPLGMDLTIKNGVAYIEGTNHWLEWLHHFTPGARRREVRWAYQVVDALNAAGVIPSVLAGHSVGGTVAIIAAGMYANLGVRLYTYGAKRPPRGHYSFGKHYRIKGDPVPLLPPWRPKLAALITLDYGKLGPVAAHGPRSYYEQMSKDGVR